MRVSRDTLAAALAHLLLETNHRSDATARAADVLREYSREIDEYMREPIGTCPACGEEVLRDAECVWTCPRDLSPDSRYWEPSTITQEQQDREQVWSYCYEDFDGVCGDHMPLHAACYDKGGY